MRTIQDLRAIRLLQERFAGLQIPIQVFDVQLIVIEEIAQEESGDDKQPPWDLVRSLQCLNPDSLAA